jgi:beta-galactosidase
MVLRDRNHPSIIMWSIGNEIPGMYKPEVVKMARMLGNFIRKIDPTRPITAAVNNLKPDKDAFFATLDIAGYNYAVGGDHNKNSLYAQDHSRIPERIMYGAESYPLEAFGSWMAVEDNSYVIGDFVWTAFDYIGEASIGWRGYMQESNFYPWNLAFCGDIDICGWKRPQSYYRDVLWNKDEISVVVTSPEPSFELNPNRESWSKWHWHDVLADWNWDGYENIPLEVTVYSSCESVELFLNGQSLGKKYTDRSTQYLAKWEVPYQSGELKAVGYSAEKQAKSSILNTAGEAHQIKVTADRSILKSDGQDLSYITIGLVDNNGNLNPKAQNLLKFDINGPGKIIGVGSANPISLESYQQNQRHAWKGKCLVIVKSERQEGEIEVTIQSDSIRSSSIRIKVEK